MEIPVEVVVKNPLRKKLQLAGFDESRDEMLFGYADWWLHSNGNLPDETLWELFQSSFGYHMYLDRGYVVVDED